ncbi:MAG TPA: hypothetical protein PLI18_04980 [Pirellulaceae bacterium]|nr:hypothetical protein [Pirellulaceae bacterium]
MVIEKSAPEELRLGEPAVFRIVVRNTGDAVAHDVTVTDRVPEGATFRESVPAAARNGRDGLVWAIGDLQPGQETEIRSTLIPERTGEIGSVAQVTFLARAASRSRVTQPVIGLQVTAAESARVGDAIEVRLRISNDGDGLAQGVILETDIDPSLSHPAGRELRYVVGDLPPGESRDVTLTLTGIRAAEIVQRFVAHGEGIEPVEKPHPLVITAPELTLEVAGPSLRFLERKAIHRLTIGNRGTAAAEQVELVATLPQGLKFVAADQQGTYDPRTHAVYWSLVELNPEQAGTVRMETIPEQTGEFAIEYRVAAIRLEPIVDRQTMMVRQLAEVTFEISDEIDQIEVESETVYRISVGNQGTKDSRRIAIRLEFPPGIEPTDDISSPLRFRREGRTIVFETLERLAPEESFEIEVRAIGRAPGDHRVAVELATEERPDWVRREESTHVYADR